MDVSRRYRVFGPLKAMSSFLGRFGVNNGKGAFTLPATCKTLMNSLVWIGKILGCLASDEFIDRTGYKRTMHAAAIIQIVTIISELWLATFNPSPLEFCRPALPCY